MKSAMPKKPAKPAKVPVHRAPPPQQVRIIGGAWKRTALPVLDAQGLRPTPDRVRETVFNWINHLWNGEWAGADCLAPNYTRCLLSLSRGGADATVVREFDLVTRSFVTQDGFALPEAKSSVDWVDANTVMVSTDFGPGSMTKSGYARIVREWKRGTPLADARTVYEAQV